MADVVAREADGVGAAVVVEVGRRVVGAVDGDGGGGDVAPRAEGRPGVILKNRITYKVAYYTTFEIVIE